MVPSDQPATQERPSPPEYLRWLEDDASLLIAAARSAPRAAVPTCPGWTARDVVDHTGEVYAHKIAAMRLGRRPADGDWPWAPDDDSVFGWFSERLAELVAELGARDPAASSWTWFPGDQTVGFWLRRMAHETAIHRVDAQLAAGVPLTPHDPRLAADGVDELLGTFLPPDSGDLASGTFDAGRPGTVAVEAGDRRWLLELPDAGSRLAAVGEPVDADARVVGSAPDVYRALWNRPTDEHVGREGDPQVLARLDARLRVATH
jgi:uncharacterized protein (TIGR03083 family)